MYLLCIYIYIYLNINTVDLVTTLVFLLATGCMTLGINWVSFIKIKNNII